MMNFFNLLKNSLALFSVCFTTTSFSQIEFFNSSLTDPDLKLVYAGHPNTIVLSSELNENQELTSSGSGIEKLDSVTYILTPRYSTGIDTISILNNGIVAQSDYFRILNMPVSSVQIGPIAANQKFVTLQTLLSEPVLHAIPNGLYINKQTILSFDLSIYDVNGELIQAFDETIGHAFTEEQITRIKSMNSGDQLEISQIKVQDILNITRILRDYRVSIK